MGKMGAYQPPDKYKNYLLTTTKPLKSHALYKEKVWTIQEQIYKKLKKVAEFLENLYPKLTDDFSKHIKVVVEKNLKTLIEDLNLMQIGFHKNPEAFSTKKLKINQKRIVEMKNVCDTLQTVSSYERESKHLGKIKHALNELEHLIQPTIFEIGLKKSRATGKPKKVAAKKERVQVKAKNLKKESNLKKQKTVAKKAKPAKKVPGKAKSLLER